MITFGIPGFGKLRLLGGMPASVQVGADNFADAPEITLGAYFVDTAAFTEDAGGPNAWGATKASAWWKFIPTETKTYTVSVFRAKQYQMPHLAVFSGSAVNNLTEIASNPRKFNQYSIVKMSLTAGVPYHIFTASYYEDDEKPKGGPTYLVLSDSPHYFVDYAYDPVVADFTAHPDNVFLDFNEAESLAELDISAAVNLIGLIVSYTSVLTDLDLSNNPKLTRLELFGTSFPQTVIDSIAATLVSHGEWDGHLDLSDSTNTASVSGYASLSTLVNRGWLVSIRPGSITNLTATPLSDTEIALDFTDAPLATSHFYTLNGSGNWEVPNDKVIRGLEPDTTYTIEVKGYRSAAGEPSSIVATTLP